MKRIAAGLATIAVMGLLLRSGGWRGAPAGAPVVDSTFPADDGPEARVRLLLEHAKGGDVDRYLADFTGPMRARLEREASERGREAFASELRRAAAARKGHAVFAAEADARDEARIMVESVYPDRNERQDFRLVNTADGWRVADVEAAREREPAARFGTVASFEGPDGPPVAAAPADASNP
jgi:hypothetical protein